MELLFAFLIGFFAGLRALTPAAAVAWATYLAWLRPGGVLAYMGSIVAVAIFSLAALGELVTDKLPSTPARTAPPAFAARILMGALTGACVASAGGGSALLGAVVGVVGSVAGTFGGYQFRSRLVKALGSKDLPVALLEDAIAIVGSLWVVSRF